MKIFIFSLLILFYLNSTLAQGSVPKCLVQVGESFNIDKKIINEWRQDSSGCNNFRCSQSEYVENNKHLIGMPRSLFLMLFGKPNKIDEENVMYFTCSKCITGKISNQMDGCFIWVIFENGKLKSVVKGCT